MPNFGKKSLDNLKTCDKRIQEVCFEVITIFDFTVLCGHRGKEEQDLAFKEKRSKLEFPQSKHNKLPSIAVDIAPWFKVKPHIRWDDIRSFDFLAGHIIGVGLSKGIKIKWGGCWRMDNDLKNNSFNDLPHFELIIN
jgi:peptidoglycan L-alanyl-D-glutamate endopeptidase CwlK